MAEEEADFSVLDAAFGRTKLPIADSLDCKLGNEPWDAYVFHLLKLAGVIVELVNSPVYADHNESLLHNSVQIVERSIVEKKLAEFDLDDIAFLEHEETDGIQVKLNNAFSWKVTIHDEIPKQVQEGQSRASRKSTVTANTMKTVQTRNLYEIVVNSSEQEGAPHLRTTVAAAQIITINIAFKKVKGKTVMSTNYPLVAQRRVDVVFTNQHVVTTQVRSVFCSLFYILCSASCNLKQPTARAAVCILGRRNISRRLAQHVGV
jgi:CRISPR/Cas system CSM-associated protein Csm2 small subunit